MHGLLNFLIYHNYTSYLYYYYTYIYTYICIYENKFHFLKTIIFFMVLLIYNSDMSVYYYHNFM